MLYTQPCSKRKLEQELYIIFSNNSAQINEWLDIPIPRLDGECPRIMLDTVEKREELFQVLQEMKFGAIA